MQSVDDLGVSMGDFNGQVGRHIVGILMMFMECVV